MTNLEISTCIVYFNFKVALEKRKQMQFDQGIRKV